MKKFFINTIICSALTISILGGGIEVKAATNTLSTNQENVQAVTELSAKERLEAEAKIKLADEYIKTKTKPTTLSNKTSTTGTYATLATTGYGYANTLSNYATVKQQQGNWCGPAAAYNATNGRRTQTAYATDLLTNMYGSTPFPGTWAYVLNTDKPGNNYSAIWAHDYSDWRSRLKNSIIYTIDKGYPVIADCHITTDTNTRIHSGYSYATDTKHFVVVVGYDDRPATNPAEVLIVDSNTKTTIPVQFWTTLDKLKAATQDYGIIW